MSRHFGLTSREALGGIDRPPGSLGSKHYALPQHSLASSTDAPLELSEVSDSSRNIIAMVFFALFISSVAAFVGVAIYVFAFWARYSSAIPQL